MFKHNKKTIISWFSVIVWMFVIFSLSAQPATESNGLSSKLTKFIIDTIGRLIPFEIEISTSTDFVSRFNHVIRKFAHFSAYLVLGVLVVNAFKQSGMRGYKALVFSLVFCVLYASSDEIHQLFVQGRGGQIKDVLIDSWGATVGIMIYEVFDNFIGKRRNIDVDKTR